MQNQKNHTRTRRPRARITAQKPKNYGLKFMVIVLLIAMLAFSFLVGTTLRSCTDKAQKHETSSDTELSSSAYSETELIHTIAHRAAEKLESLQENDVVISNILEEDLVRQIKAQAQTNADIAWIAANPSAYDIDGYAVQYKILKLAAEEPAAAGYVRNWPDMYPANDQNKASSNAIPSTKTGPHNIPQLFQWDSRWGYTVYSSTAFGLTGCCPTTLAMVYQGLTGKTNMTPYNMGVLAETNGYMATYEGTDAYFLLNEAPGLGLNCWEIYTTAESVVAALEAGQVLIANVGPGDFTSDGHFIVITGLKDGKLIVNDPYSKVRSEKLWDTEQVVAQSMVIFAFTKA